MALVSFGPDRNGLREQGLHTGVPPFGRPRTGIPPILPFIPMAVSGRCFCKR